MKIILSKVNGEWMSLVEASAGSTYMWKLQVHKWSF